MITSASTYCFISDGSTCRLLTTSPIGLLLFSTFSSFLIGRRCPGRDDGGYVRLADQLVEGRYIRIENFLQALQLYIDASYKVIEKLVLLPCRCGISTGHRSR